MNRTTARGTAAVTGAVLALGLGLSAPGAQAAPIPAPAGSDPAPAAAGARYLAAQPGADSLVKTFYVYPEGNPPQSYTDYGLTVDLGFALDAVGSQGAKLTAVTDALVANIGNYAFSGGARAKLASFLVAQGRTGASITELVTALEGNVSEEAGIVGRLVDADPNDYNSPLTQAYAASALDLAGSDEAAAARTFLLAQQCDEGFFRQDFSAKDAADQTCDGAATTTPSVDSTGLAVLMLQSQKDEPVVAAAIESAVAWLISQQADNGSFGGNANSTGLAGWAMGVAGATDYAADAASWLRAHQLANAGACVPFATKDSGAVTLDDLGFANAKAGALDAVDNSVATRASTQAVPALLWADGGNAMGKPSVDATAKLVRAGSQQPVTLTGAPGDTLCVSAAGARTLVTLPATGTARSTVTLPARTARTAVSVVDAGGQTASVTIRGLAGLKVRFATATKVRKGKRVVVKVRGLAAGESITVAFRGKKVVTTKANASGRKTVRFRATKLGRAKLVVRGEFANRRGTKVVTVTR
ncbi:prenyltransferase/squalene oxidase repeat-containing protein [Nocardioides lianchengensis]|uniref:Prenyltransferase and squalene oxidase repeat-containing protein n=1 Tax=Nocardioides lianchengensis TaxID=1045774 RepID=A0A1G6NUJ2_9ACTN|nr:prenyltransferase/squalene oxidase repeat-containing protein [Nocardioides lianchengensis]NYG10877.1 hypothetical protein [Nocardioides lianchengensis]SDC70907.1 hypothetical protein SAMN05421872_103362 [Nocardioides lianchengensis]